MVLLAGATDHMLQMVLVQITWLTSTASTNPFLTAYVIETYCPAIVLTPGCSGEQPAARTVVVNSSLLASSNRLSLALPGANLVIRRRRDVPSPLGDSSTVSATSGTPAVSIWIGEVAGQQRGGSSAVLVTAENGGVYGKITYIERRANKQRTFTVRRKRRHCLCPAAMHMVSLHCPVGHLWARQAQHTMSHNCM